MDKHGGNKEGGCPVRWDHSGVVRGWPVHKASAFRAHWVLLGPAAHWLGPGGGVVVFGGRRPRALVVDSWDCPWAAVEHLPPVGRKRCGLMQSAQCSALCLGHDHAEVLAGPRAGKRLRQDVTSTFVLPALLLVLGVVRDPEQRPAVGDRTAHGGQHCHGSRATACPFQKSPRVETAPLDWLPRRLLASSQLVPRLNHLWLTPPSHTWCGPRSGAGGQAFSA